MAKPKKYKVIETVYDIEDEEDNELKKELYSLDKDVMDIYMPKPQIELKKKNRSSAAHKRGQCKSFMSLQQIMSS